MTDETPPSQIVPEGPPSRASLSMTQLQVWESPFPPPDAIERYEHVLPGTFDRLIAMAEQNQRLQFEENQRVMGYIHAETTRGQWMGFVVTCIAIGGAIGAAWVHQPVVASLLVGVPVMSVAKAFLESVRKPK